MVIQPKKVVGEFHHQTDGGWKIWCFNQRICLGVNHQPWIPNLEVSWWFHWLRGGLKKMWFDHEWSQEGSSASPTWAEFPFSWLGLDGKQWLRMSFVDPCPYPFDGRFLKQWVCHFCTSFKKTLGCWSTKSGWALTKDLVKWWKFWAWARVSEVHG